MPTNIGIAFEDVISENPDLWGEFTKYARLEGHSIFIVAEDPSYTAIDQLEYMGLYHQINWDSVLSVFSFLSAKGVDLYIDEVTKRWKARDGHAWYNAKARMCFENKIAIMFEENPRYFAAFGNIVTRLVNIRNKSDFEMILSTTEKLKKINSWFDDFK